MDYWRMQLHPDEAGKSVYLSAQSLSAGFIGLDFKNEVGDLNHAEPDEIEPEHRDYMDFCKKMNKGDKVLIIAHHFPFALCTVTGDYNYIARPEPELGVWFRHFRRIDINATKYFGDKVTNAKDWQPYKMTDAISILIDPNSKSYKLIEAWRK